MNKIAIETLEDRIKNLVVQKTTSPVGYHKGIDEEINANQQAIKTLQDSEGKVIFEGEVEHYNLGFVYEWRIGGKGLEDFYCLLEENKGKKVKLIFWR
jgi:hypothetical protein